MDTTVGATAETSSQDYRVNLNVFAGPMDLLLYLIKKEEVDIYDIPISRITQQYLTYLDMMRTLDLEVAGEFILMAATLIHLKARLLLPRDENEPDEEDPREELIMALLEYKKYKEASEILKDRALVEEQTFVPPPVLQQVQGRVELSPATTLYDLLTAFRDVMTARRDEVVHEVVPEEISIEERIKAVMASLSEKEWATFTELFDQMSKRIMAVVTFIAILELARTRRIRIMQSQPFAELRIYRGEYYDSPQRSIDLVNPLEVLEQAEVN
jgi:segregation and condensation protein A